MKDETKGKVFLIGAGPGHPKLITLRAIECIRDADVIVYDYLANQKFLQYAREGCETIYAGKTGVHHTLHQGDINRVLVDKARQGKKVARLKGGDPLIYGRGGEEAEDLVDAGIDFEIVPGVPAATAAAAYAGIPLTHRNFSSTVAFVTGHEGAGKTGPAVDWEKLSTGVGTLAIYMGVGNLKANAETLMAHGRPADTPVALIRWGTTPEQEVLTGTLVGRRLAKERLMEIQRHADPTLTASQNPKLDGQLGMPGGRHGVDRHLLKTVSGLPVLLGETVFEIVVLLKVLKAKAGDGDQLPVLVFQMVKRQRQLLDRRAGRFRWLRRRCIRGTERRHTVSVRFQPFHD